MNHPRRFKYMTERCEPYADEFGEVSTVKSWYEEVFVDPNDTRMLHSDYVAARPRNIFPRPSPGKMKRP